jgi:hypothetical protein
MPLKAIDTRYGGYLFRSRLEARWAVYFKTVGIDFEYESEGFDLPSGYYLPDFYLRDIDVYIEIKPQWPTEKDDLRAKQLGRELRETGSYFVILYGDPLDFYTGTLSKERLSFWEAKGGPWHETGWRWMEKTSNIGHPERVQAARRAREARFEHGARP